MKNTPSASKAVRWAVLASLLGSALALPLTKAGLGEPYPFFHWKLYTSPHGAGGQSTDYRFYRQKPGSSQPEREALHPVPGLTLDEYYYTLNYWATRCQTGDPQAPDALQALHRYVNGGQEQPFTVISETYSPETLTQNPQTYETEPVCAP